MSQDDSPGDLPEVEGPFDIPLLSDKIGISGCPNEWMNITRDKTRLPSECWRFKGLVEMGFLAYLGKLCRDAKVSRCRSSSHCQQERQLLEQTLPTCWWKHLRDWLVEALACSKIHSEREHTLPAPVYDCIYTAQVQTAHEELLQKGETGLELDIFRMLFWIDTVWLTRSERHFTRRGVYIPDFMQHYQSLQFPQGLGKFAIFYAAQKAQGLGICPNRLWNIASASPCGEADIYTLVEAISHAGSVGSFRTPEHGDCNADFCEIGCENATRKEQMHKCASGECTFHSDTSPRQLRSFPQNTIVSALNEKRPTAWRTGEESTLCEETDRYIAISHVWSDGTGVGVQEPGKVNPCLFEYFAAIATDLDCQSVWWDTICIPSDRKARGLALNSMQDYFRLATWTVVHDEFLVQFPWSDDGIPSLAVILSSWFTRGWTALELAFSKRVKIIFRDGKTGARVLKDLDADVLSDPRSTSRPTLAHWVATQTIRQIRSVVVRKQVNGEWDNAWFLRSLAHRTTSWARDRSTIAALVAGVKDVGSCKTQAEITRETLRKIGKIPYSILFHGFPTMSEHGGFSWCPHTLFNGQQLMGSKYGEDRTATYNLTLKVGNEGELEGVWKAFDLSENVARAIKPQSFHPWVDLKIANALQQLQNCLLISRHSSKDLRNELDFKEQRLCLLVFVQGCGVSEESGEPVVDCQYVGCVHQPTNLEIDYYPNVRLGKFADRPGVNAAEALREHMSQRRALLEGEHEGFSFASLLSDLS